MILYLFESLGNNISKNCLVLRRKWEVICEDFNQSYSYDDFYIPFSQPLQWLKDYLRDHFRIEHNKTLIPKLDFGIILDKKQQSHNRNLVEPLDLLHAPDYTCIYGVDIDDTNSTRKYYRNSGSSSHFQIHSNNYWLRELLKVNIVVLGIYFF